MLESVYCLNVSQRVRQFVPGVWSSDRKRMLSELGDWRVDDEVARAAERMQPNSSWHHSGHKATKIWQVWWHTVCFSEHITNIVRKVHQRANLIHRCFTCKNPDLLVEAFEVYVRPILEFNSPVWSPSLTKDILLIKSVQRKFTKRIPSMSVLTYYARLQVLGLESREIGRLRTDVLLVYRIMFGMVRLNSNDFFHVKKSTTPARSQICHK